MEEVHEEVVEEVVATEEIVETPVEESEAEVSAESTTEAEEVVEEQADEALEAEEAPECVEAVEEAVFSADEFKRTVEAFGAEIAAVAFTNGGGYDAAKDAHYAAIAEENEVLKKQLGAKKDTVAPVPASKEVAPKRSLFNTVK